MTPDFLRHCISGSIRRSLTTRTNRYDVMPTHTLRFRYSFFPDTSNSWNHFSTLIKCSPTLNVFKKRYMEFFNDAPNPIYGIHNPVGIKYLTRLRVGLSHLRIHKFHHNFGDTTSGSCSCGKPETVEHYLLHCPNYTLIRSELFAKLRTFISLLTLTSSSYTCNLLLFGNPNYDFYTNKKILEITICFITTSKRFLVPLIN